MFENFASYSRAKVSLSVQVTTIGEVEAKDGRKEYTLEYHDARPEISGSSTETFDTVILAAPYSQAGLNLITSDPTSAHVPPQTYVHLHVTFIATNASSPSAKAFGRKEKDWPVPKTVLSTMMRNVEGGGKHRPRFNSLSFLRNVGQRKGIEGDVHMVKSMRSTTFFAPVPDDCGSTQCSPSPDYPRTTSRQSSAARRTSSGPSTSNGTPTRSCTRSRQRKTTRRSGWPRGFTTPTGGKGWSRRWRRARSARGTSLGWWRGIGGATKSTRAGQSGTWTDRILCDPVQLSHLLSLFCCTSIVIAFAGVLPAGWDEWRPGEETVYAMSPSKRDAIKHKTRPRTSLRAFPTSPTESVSHHSCML